MALPTIDVPTYELTIPSTKKVLKVRPFSVKEEKLLLIAVEGGTPDDIISTVKQIINNCILEGEFDINKAPFFDVDYIFIFLRAKSIGSTVDVNLTCNNILDTGEKCGHTFPTAMDIEKAEMIENNISNDIRLDKDKGVRMKYPNYSVIKHIEEGNSIDKKVGLVINSIDHIYDKKGIYPARDHSKEELKDFVEKLTEENFKKLENYVDNFPSFAVRLEADCPKCSFHHNVRYTDFYDFFF